MALPDLIGLFGVVLILIAYGGTTAKRLDPAGAPALLLNLFGAALILLSLYFDFNLSAVLMEGIWALIAVAGLGRLAWMRMRAT